MISPKPETFAAYVRRNRISAGMKQDALAKKAGISQSYVSAIERGVNVEVDPDYVRQIADALGVDQSEALAVAGATVGYVPELTRELDPDTAEMVEFYEGLSPTNRSISKSMAKQLREAERKASIGGGAEPGEN